MKRILKIAIALIALASPALADPAEGIWQTEVDDGKFAYITMAPCGGAYMRDDLVHISERWDGISV